MLVPSLDLLAHNLVALCVAMLVLLLFSQLVVAAVLRTSKLLLRASLLKGVTAADEEAFRRGVRRKSFVGVAAVMAVLLCGALLATVLRIRALDWVKATIAQLRPEDIENIKERVL